MYIEQLKADLLVKHLGGTLGWIDIRYLPIDDSIRTFVCGLDPQWAYWYALDVDRKPHSETRTAACGDTYYAYRYAKCVDRGPSDETREAAFKDSSSKYLYIEEVGK